MFKKTSIFLLSLFLFVCALAQGALARPADSQTQKAVSKAAQEAAIEQTKQAALNVDFYADHFTFEDIETEDDRANWEADKVSITIRLLPKKRVPLKMKIIRIL